MCDDEIIKNEVIKDIYNIIYKIKKCHSKSMYNVLMSDLSMLYKLAYDLDIYDVPDVDKFSYKSYSFSDIKVLKDMLSMYNLKILFYKKFTDSYMTLFEKNYSIENSEYDFEYLINKKVDIKQSIILVKDFLSINNKFLYDKFIELSKNHRIIYIPNKLGFFSNYGTTYYSITNNFNPYILLNDISTISTSISLVHELGHIYDYELTKNGILKERINKSYSNYMEVYSHYMELLFIDFLKNQKVYTNDINAYKMSYIDTLSKEVIELYKLLNKQIYNINHIYENYPDIFTIPEYALGKAIAYEFYDMYKEDKERTNVNIHKFLINYGKDTELKFLDYYGLNKEKIMSGNAIKKHILEL